MTREEKAVTLSRLLSVVTDHSTYNWDGHGALPISSKTHEACIIFVHAILDYPPPSDIIPDNDGEISFEWRTPHKLLSVSVSEGERMTWIYRDGIRPASGTDVGLSDGLPDAIARRLRGFGK